MCLANPALSPQEACVELEKLHDQVHYFYFSLGFIMIRS